MNGLREFARARGATVRCVPLSADSLRVAGLDLAAALGRGGRRRGPFAYPAQSNFSGVQHPAGTDRPGPARPLEAWRAPA